MNKIKLLLTSAGCGVLFALSWPEIGGSVLSLFIAFFPLLWVEEQISKERGLSWLAVFFQSYVAFFVFNLITTYWIYHASLWGACMAVICNSLFMAIVFTLFHVTKMKVGRKEGYIAFVLYWVAFEYLHLNWELSWTWLTLGNAFANKPNLVQWYEYTGVLGGSVFVLVMNLLAFFGLRELQTKSNLKFRYLGVIVLSITGSFLLSMLALQNDNTTGDEVEVVIVQPNIDPYTTKFRTPPSVQIDKMIELAKEKLTPTTDFLIFPETAIPESHWEHEIEFLYATEKIRELHETSPNLKTIVGSLSTHLFLPGEELTPAARQFRDGNGYYENYNSAIYIDSSEQTQLHKKSKLVLGVEKLPFINALPLLKKLSINLGGTSGVLGYSEHPSVFQSGKDSAIIAPIICYESIYGEYVTEYSRQGANLFAIITNDGWWDDTPGYQQHMAYARLRAIENRKVVVRSANTGISAVIDERGNVLQATEWDEEAVISAKVKLNSTVTFYAQYGDYIGRIASLLSGLMIALTVVRTLNKTGKRLAKT